ncbi:MAG: PAS domain S-box protein [Ilumatobacteraceae bacterium]
MSIRTADSKEHSMTTVDGRGLRDTHDDAPSGLETVVLTPEPGLLDRAAGDHPWSLDHAADATLVVATSGFIVFANERAVELFDVLREDLVGMSVDDLLPERGRAAHRAHRTRYRAAPTDRTIGTDLGVWARRADGSELPVEISLATRPIGGVLFTVASVRDISDRAEANHHHRRVLQMLDASNDAVFIFDATTLKYSYVNDGAVRLVGYSRDELLGMTPLHLNPYDSETDYQELVGGLLSDGTASVLRQATLLCKDGTEVLVEKTLRIAAIGGDGVHAVIAMARDITARQAAEGELRDSKGALFLATRLLAHDRERIAADLHDTVSERLFGEGLNLQAALVEIGRGKSDAACVRVQATVEGLDRAIRELRMAIFALEDVGSAPGRLRASLLEEVMFATDGLDVHPHVEFDGPIETVDETSGGKLTSALRSVLSDLVHHEHADNLRIEVRVADQIILTVTDDGLSAPESLSRPARMTRHAAELGCVVTMSAEPAGGTTVVWRIPIHLTEPAVVETV